MEVEGAAAPVRVEAVELIRIDMPLVAPFRTSFGTQTCRDVLLVHVLAEGGEGWGECVAMHDPLSSPEYVDTAERVIADHLLPRLLRAGAASPECVAGILRPVKGHRMAKAALEMAWLDASLRATGTSLAAHLGAARDRVPSGVSVGIEPSIDELLDVVARHLEHGYLRVTLKIAPGWDLEPVRAVRERFGYDLPLQVDANTAYSIDDADHLAKLDQFGLLLIEQPLAEDELIAHARLAGKLRTPLCLDESIVSAAVAAESIEMRACGVVNVNAGRAGGYLEARRIHDVCQARGVPAVCGGMLDTGIGRAANIALAALPGFTLPGDIAASDRWFARDITAPFALGGDGYLAVPTAPGIGVDVRRDVVDALTTSRQLVTAP